MIRKTQNIVEPRTQSVLARLAMMAGVVAALIGGSSRTRRMPPGQRSTVTINTMFFVALGVADEVMLGTALRTPLLRAMALVVETLTLGWFFFPGGAKPASRTLFYVHIAPFFGAVFSGATAVALGRWWRER